MEEDEDVTFSDYEIEDLFASTIQEAKTVRGNPHLRSEALDQSKYFIGFFLLFRIWLWNI